MAKKCNITSKSIHVFWGQRCVLNSKKTAVLSRLCCLTTTWAPLPESTSAPRVPQKKPRTTAAATAQLHRWQELSCTMQTHYMLKPTTWDFFSKMYESQVSVWQFACHINPKAMGTNTGMPPSSEAAQKSAVKTKLLPLNLSTPAPLL